MIKVKDDRLGDIIIELSWGFVLSHGLSDHPPTSSIRPTVAVLLRYGVSGVPREAGAL
jgi:hypothetical protein